MGDKANIIFLDGEEQVCFYTHCGGSVLPEVLRAALIRGKDRWDDPSYLARIIFSEMIQDDILGETGFGISQKPLYAEDNGSIFVNAANNSVGVNNKFPISFSEYCESEQHW